MDTKLYTLSEVADYLQVTHQTIYNYIRGGKLEAHKIGKEYRISAEAVNKLLNAKQLNTN